MISVNKNMLFRTYAKSPQESLETLKIPKHGVCLELDSSSRIAEDMIKNLERKHQGISIFSRALRFIPPMLCNYPESMILKIARLHCLLFVIMHAHGAYCSKQSMGEGRQCILMILGDLIMGA